MAKTSITEDMRPTVTAMARAILRSNIFDTYADMLRATAPLYGHANREVIGRAHIDRLDTLR